MRSAVRGVLLMIALAIVTVGVGCGAEPEAAAWLAGVHVPADVRPGTPLLARGAGLLGLALRLEANEGHINVALSSRPDPGMWPALARKMDGPWTHGVVSSAPGTLPDGTALTRACLVPKAAGGEARRCVALTGVRWRGTQLPEGTPVLTGSGPIRLQHGALVPFGGAIVPLPGEGTATLSIEVRRGPETLIAGPIAVLPWKADGTRGASLLVAPAWLGTALGPAEVRLRLHHSVPAGSGTTAWSPWQSVDVVLPPLHLPASSEMGRGLPVPGTQIGSEWPIMWRGGPRLSLAGLTLAVAGDWQATAGKTSMTWPLAAPQVLPVDGRLKPSAVLRSHAWFAGEWAAHVGETLVGVLRWRLSVAPSPALAVASADGVAWSGPTVFGPGVAARLDLQPTVQRVEVLVSPSGVAGLARLGLAAAADPIFARVAALVRAHFSPWSVEVRLSTDSDPFPDGAEWVCVAVLDRDPNGSGLLGNDPTVGKDTGNRLLNERLDGVIHLEGRAVGQPAYGGVFLAGFFLFSPTANPGGGVADPAFDQVFSPFSPVLGGDPVDVKGVAQATTAMETIAQLIAGTVSHEVGHTLGLANVDGYHHTGDNPGWRMDSGTLRPFAERANLPGSGGERWGPVDSAYLDQILPKDPP